MKNKWAVNLLKDRKFRIKLYIFIVIAQIVATFSLALGGVFFILILSGVI